MDTTGTVDLDVDEGHKAIAAELRSLIDGSARLDPSRESYALVTNLIGSFMTTKAERQGPWRARRDYFAQLEKELVRQERALVEMRSEFLRQDADRAERGVVGESVWPLLRELRRRAQAELDATAGFVGQGDEQRRRAVGALHEAGLSYGEIAELIRATDGVDWQSGERTRPPSDYLSKYLDPEALPDRQWGADDGKGQLVDAIKKLCRRSVGTFSEPSAG